MARSNSLKTYVSILLPPAFWLGAWQLGAFLVELHVEGRGNELLLPYPATVLSALVRLAQDPAFWGTALTSLLRIAWPWGALWPPSPAPAPGASGCSPR